ncbi:hypothetical protein B0H11DRAFT_2036565 [Mycena galericulata]|nr:hypothetical protein B0H11DRAFT_2036565 [Mycena galericulata]
MELCDYEKGVELTRVKAPFPPLPEHEYCTPTVRNIFQGDDPHEKPFIPFADDPTFKKQRIWKITRLSVG